MMIKDAERSLVRSSWESVDFFRTPPSNGESELAKLVVGTDEPEFHIQGRKWKANGRLGTDGFTVFAGSTVNDITPSFAEQTAYCMIRLACEAQGAIVDNTFVRDYTFKSAAQAACVVAAALVNARKAWVTEPDENGKVVSFGEAHPKATKAKKPIDIRRRNERQARREEIKRGVLVIRWTEDGYEYEHRGQLPFAGIFGRTACA